MRRVLRVGPVVASRTGLAQRVTAMVANQALWYESADAALDNSPEAMAGAMLMPAVAARRKLVVAEPVSPEWLANVGCMLEIWHRWWGYGVVVPGAPVLSERRPRQAQAALCFSGGVDSFHTLLFGTVRPDVLAFIAGYDIALGDRIRLAAWDASLRQVAAAVGARPVLLRSNLRQHPFTTTCSWDRSHGGAMAATGHLLAGEVGTLLISSSFPASYPYRWGSHWQLDPLWSSERLEVVHVGATHSRLEKVREIAGHEVAQRHLRVCWENRAEAGNCSRCDKCLCTMALIAACGPSDRFVGFDWHESLARRIDRLSRTRWVLTYSELLTTGLNGPLGHSIRSLLKRTPAP